jgi:tetratricopeptide (TPR) repeat protein
MVVVCLNGLARADAVVGRSWNPSQLVAPIPPNEKWEDTEARLIMELQKAKKAGVPQDLARAIQNLAYRYWERGSYPKAIAAYSEALEVTKKMGESKAPEVAICLNNIGVLYRELGRLDLAKRMHTAALEIAEKVGIPEVKADTYFSLGLLEMTSGRYQEAETYLDKAVAFIEHSRRGTMYYARLMDAYARLYILAGKLRKADHAMQRSWAVIDKMLPEDHPQRIQFLDTKASLSFSVRRFTEAEKAWTRAVEIADGNGLGETPEIVPVISHLGELYVYFGEPQKAEQYLQRTVKMMTALMGPRSVDAASIMSELAYMYTRTGDFTRAKDKFDGAFAILDTAVTNRPLELAMLLTYYGEYLRAQDRWAEAYAQYKRAADLRAKALGEHPLVASTYQLCAIACKRLKMKTEARDYKARAQEISEKFPDQELTAVNVVDLKTLKSERAAGFVGR